MCNPAKRIALVIVTIFLIASLIAPPILAESESRTIVVPDDYPTIQEAIGNATEGDTIFVKKGTYEIKSPDPSNPLLLSGIKINKPLSIIGEDPENTTIVFPPDTRQGFMLMVTKVGFNVTADNFEISNLTIRNCDYDLILHGNRAQVSNIITACMSVYGNYCNLIGNTLYGTYNYGLYVYGSFNNFMQIEASGIVCHGSYNYWDDYSGSDNNGDGIGDTPYIGINEIQESYPLMGPITTFDAGTWDGTPFNVDFVSNSTLTHFNFNPVHARIFLIADGKEGTRGFCRVTIPKELLTAQGNWTVLINDISRPTTVNEDATNTYIYFSYGHSIKTIKIIGIDAIPEFPSWTILPLLIIATLTAITYRKRLSNTRQSHRSY